MPMGTYGSVCPSLLISEPANLQMNSYEVPPSWAGNVPQFLQLGLKKQDDFQNIHKAMHYNITVWGIAIKENVKSMCIYK